MVVVSLKKREQLIYNHYEVFCITVNYPVFIIL